MPSPLSAVLHALQHLRSRGLRPSAGQVAATFLVIPAFAAMAVFASMATHTSGTALASQAGVIGTSTTHVADRQVAAERVNRSAVRPPAPVAPVKPAAKPVPPKPAVHRWVRPSGGPLSSPFGGRWGRMHEGIDLAAAYGTPIVAATDGNIIFAGPESGYGRLILIRDYDGTVTAYGHMSKFIRTSGPVHAGELIALVGAAGDATGAHLHFEVRIGDRKVDPIPVLASHGVRI